MRIELAQCILRSFEMSDAPALVVAANNRNVWLRLRDAFPHPYTLADAEKFLDGVAKGEHPHVTCIEIEGKVAGGIGLHLGQDVHRRTAEFGYWLAEPYWNRGIMTETARAFVDHCFETMSLDRIFAMPFANNPASVRVLEKIGFQFEGRLRSHVIKDGVMLDSLLYARLRDE